MASSSQRPMTAAWRCLPRSVVRHRGSERKCLSYRRHGPLLRRARATALHASHPPLARTTLEPEAHQDMGNQRSEGTSTPVQPLGNHADSAPATSRRAEIDRFLDQIKTLGPAVKAGSRGRLIFGLDATMSRQPTWDQACKLQAEMFREAAAIGGLDIQLVYYRGLVECRASSWIADSDRLGTLMSGIDCRGGHTQIAKVLAHALRENESSKVAVLVFVGDAMEESLDELCARAGELGLRNVKAFMFQEGYDPISEQAFREIARLTGGAFCRFAPGAAHELAE